MHSYKFFNIWPQIAYHRIITLTNRTNIVFYFMKHVFKFTELLRTQTSVWVIYMKFKYIRNIFPGNGGPLCSARIHVSMTNDVDVYSVHRQLHSLLWRHSDSTKIATVYYLFVSCRFMTNPLLISKWKCFHASKFSKLNLRSNNNNNTHKHRATNRYPRIQIISTIENSLNGF
jgi:hypothetical protein